MVMTSENIDPLQIIQGIAALATPLVVLVLGLSINRRLEQAKQSLSKEKEWQSQWADRFFARAIEFNDAAEDVILLLWEIGQISQRTGDDSISKMKGKEELIWAATERLTRAEWSLKIPLQLAPNFGPSVLAAASKVFQLIRQLLKNKQGEMDPIRTALVQFNTVAKNAHRELLAL
jgi:hypothetical protein